MGSSHSPVEFFILDPDWSADVDSFSITAALRIVLTMIQITGLY